MEGLPCPKIWFWDRRIFVTIGVKSVTVVNMKPGIEHQIPPETLASRLKGTRTSLEINQRELARRAGVSHSLISVLESGRRKTVSIDSGANLAKVLGVTLAWLRCVPGASKDRPESQNERPAPLAFCDLRTDPDVQANERDQQEIAQAQSDFHERESLAATLMSAAPGMRALTSDEARSAVIQLFKLMIEFPEKTTSLGEAIHTMATAHQHRTRLFTQNDAS